MIISNIQRYLTRKKIDAFLITQPENRFYISGFAAADTSINESSGSLLILRNGPSFLLTDFRYKIQAERENSHFEVIIYNRGLFPTLLPLLSKLSVSSLAFESNYLLHSEYQKLSKLAQTHSVSLLPLTGTIEKFRIVKMQHELNLIKRSVALNEKVFQEVFPHIKTGQTEQEVALTIENTMAVFGAQRPSFETIVASGPNAALPHAIPGPRPLRKDETIIIDMGLVLDNYCSDMTRTIVLGTPSAKTVSLFRLVRSAQLSALKTLAPGTLCKTADSAARTIITDAGYGPNFGHSLGHGVGLAVHESPSLNSRSRKKLRSGMVVTVEPGIYIENWGGIRLENMAVITDDGYAMLNVDTTFLDI